MCHLLKPLHLLPRPGPLQVCDLLPPHRHLAIPKTTPPPRPHPLENTRGKNIDDLLQFLCLFVESHAGKGQYPPIDSISPGKKRNWPKTKEGFEK